MPSSSPSLTIPPTQNTASVVRFRCLYTYDLRRKAKRWQDGFLRYHTFNKRVMVFDDQGNFVGDLHWRQEGMIQDGDEMELDKGVLIQVGESMEKTETDLSPLFERRKASQASPSQSGSLQPRSSQVRSSMPSSQSSRSLNDLLGIKRTPIERLKSPYEQRHPPRPENPEPPRPAKRQKSASAEEGVQPKRPAVIDLSEPVNKPTTTKPKAPVPAPVPARPAKPVPEFAVTRPRAEPSRFTSTPLATTKDTSAKPVQKPHSFSENARPPPSSESSNPTVSEPKNTLRMAKDKPRKKLMYRALLPGQAKAAETSEPQPESEIKPQEAPKSVTPEPGNSTLDVLAEMLDDPMSDADEPPRIKGEATRNTENLSVPPNPPTAEPAPTPTPPMKNEPPPSRLAPDHPPEPSAAVAAINHAARSQGTPPPTKPSARGFRKSLSDPSAFHTVNGIQSRQLPSSPLNPNQGQIQDQGPWTCEAMDLFDFWPPDRPKPV